MYAEIAVNAPVDNTYYDQVPPELEGKLQVGHLVQVPFDAALKTCSCYGGGTGRKVSTPAPDGKTGNR